MDGKIDRISQDLLVIKIKDAEQSAKLDSLEEKVGDLTAKYHSIDEQLKKIELEFTPKKDTNNLYDKVRQLEETPKVKIISKIEFIKKALLAGLTVLITGMVLGLGSFIWKLIINLDTIIEAIEKLK
ncbi:MAG: hypothetical protein LBB81_01290 [Treponema sp.]|nr:hypothetical protein [Treponema sp.]